MNELANNLELSALEVDDNDDGDDGDDARTGDHDDVKVVYID